MQPADDDHELMRRIADKDLVAYRKLVAKHLNFCVRFAERMLGSRQDAEDIAQDACLKIWKEAPRWQPKAKFSTWLYRVVFNACVDHRRKILPFSGVELDELPDLSPGSDEEIIAKQHSLRVQKALYQLPQRQLAAIVLSYYEEVSNQEAADTLGIQLGAFQQLLFRAKQQLRDQLNDYYLEQKNG